MRKKYLKNNNLTVIDKSPYQEFIIECYGNTIDSSRLKYITITKRKEKGERMQFSYEPNNSDHIPTKNFKNSSGNIDNKATNWLLE
jgi:hypothetical protein